LGENRVNEDPNVFRSAKLNRISIRRIPLGCRQILYLCQKRNGKQP
jgi:hypothetical protein